MTATTRLAPPASFADTRPAAPGAMSDLGRQARTFILVGVVSTLAYAGLFTLLRVFETAAAANVVALVLTAIGNTAANRRLTFGVRGRASFVRDQLAGFIALAVALAITSGAIALLGRIAPGSDRSVELGVLIGANAVATLARFLLLRAWVRRDPLPVASDGLERSQS